MGKGKRLRAFRDIGIKQRQVRAFRPGRKPPTPAAVRERFTEALAQAQLANRARH